MRRYAAALAAGLVLLAGCSSSSTAARGLGADPAASDLPPIPGRDIDWWTMPYFGPADGSELRDLARFDGYTPLSFDSPQTMAPLLELAGLDALRAAYDQCLAQGEQHCEWLLGEATSQYWSARESCWRQAGGDWSLDPACLERNAQLDERLAEATFG